MGEYEGVFTYLRSKMAKQKNGKILESSIFVEYMKLLFNEFNEHDVHYNYLDDFSKDKEFHRMILKMLREGERLIRYLAQTNIVHNLIEIQM